VQAVGHHGLAPFRTEEIGRLWRAVGYHGGLHPLDAVVAVSLEDGMVDGAEDLPVPPVRLDDRTRRAARLFILSKTLPVATRLGPLGLLHEQAQNVEALSHARRGRGAFAGEVAARVEDLLDEVLAGRRDDLPAPPFGALCGLAWRARFG
jgi:hypothetical protein